MGNKEHTSPGCPKLLALAFFRMFVLHIQATVHFEPIQHIASNFERDRVDVSLHVGR